MNQEEKVKEIQQQTGFDEDVIGCFLSNYKVPHVCPIATGKWCRDYTKCKSIEEGINRRIKEQQAHNEKIQEAEDTYTWKTYLLVGVVVVLSVFDITMISYLVKLIFGIW